MCLAPVQWDPGAYEANAWQPAQPAQPCAPAPEPVEPTPETLGLSARLSARLGSPFLRYFEPQEGGAWPETYQSYEGYDPRWRTCLLSKGREVRRGPLGATGS